MKELSKDLNTNLQMLEEIFKDVDDLVFRLVELGESKTKACFVFIDELIDGARLSEYAIQAVLIDDKKDFNLKLFTSNLIKNLANREITISDVKEEEDLGSIVDAILSGQTAFFVEKEKKALLLETRGYPTRGISEPESETVVRGPRDGFGENLKMNMALVRRRIRDPKLKVKMKKVGRRSKTDIAIMYIEDIINENILEEVNKRIEQLDIDAILDSSTLEFLIEDNYLSPFPQIEVTERPDTVAASIYEGRVGILVDNTPFALIAPVTIGAIMQAAEDHYSRWTITSFIRLLRIFAVFLAALAPAFYIAMTSFHPGLIPTRLTYYLGASRINVPFPAVVEAFLMEITIEVLRESGTRLAGPIGSTIGIVGGLIIGQASVEAGIVSPLMIIIVAITTISVFALPNYEWASGFRFIRFGYMILAAIFGLYGIMLGIVVLFVHLAKMESFGIPYTAPYSGLGLREGDLKDTLIRAPLQKLKYRPRFTLPKDKKRMGDIKNGKEE